MSRTNINLNVALNYASIVSQAASILILINCIKYNMVKSKISGSVIGS